MAPNGGNTTFLGKDIAADDDTFHSLIFFSTAAAPMMAAVAALLKEVAPQATPPQMYARLRQTALALDDSSTPGFVTRVDLA
ncbi:MAG: S8 family serine peptidase [Cyanobacteria bacterium P01_H01_bin.153]